MSDEDLFDVLAAFGGDDPSPDFVSSLLTQLDAELTNDHRSPGDVQDVTLVEAPLYQEQQQMNKKRWIGGLAAAAAAVVVIVGAIVIANDDDDDGTVAGTSSEPPLTVIDDYFAAYNDGDTDAVLAIAAPDVIVTRTYDDVPEPVQDWDQYLAWNNAQGEVLTEHSCILTDDQPVVGAAFSCEFDTLDAVVLAVDGIPIPSQARFTVLDGAITKIHHDYDGPAGFGTAGEPFNLWMDQNHADVEGAGFGEWTSRAEAVEYGQLRAHWAQEWAIYREANDCTTPPGSGSRCPPD